MLPSRMLIGLLTASGGLLAVLCFVHHAPQAIAAGAGAAGLLLLAAVAGDALSSVADWRRTPLTLHRELPRAFAVGAGTTLRVSIDNPGMRRRRGLFFEGGDGTLEMPDMPLVFDVAPGRREILQFTVRPRKRGMLSFGLGQIRLRSNWGLLDWDLCIGSRESRRVFPSFERQADFEWLTGNLRLTQMGVKSLRRRGSATDFDQLVDYRAGDAIRHIDWKATLKHQRPIVRKFQDDRDQSVLFLLDCGRRMRSDDTQPGIGTTHFDQALNALMLLACVALKEGDAVGAMTFGTPEGAERRFAPRKGRHSLNALMAQLGDVEPSPTWSDYTRAAADVMRRQRKRGLLVLITNCRDEDSMELGVALRLLRSRHLVVLANLREAIVGQIAAQDLATGDSALEVAAALLYEQRRRDMLARLGSSGALMIDCEPRDLGVQLIGRYLALKRAGSI